VLPAALLGVQEANCPSEGKEEGKLVRSGVPTIGTYSQSQVVNSRLRK